MVKRNQEIIMKISKKDLSNKQNRYRNLSEEEKDIKKDIKK